MNDDFCAILLCLFGGAVIGCIITSAVWAVNCDRMVIGIYSKAVEYHYAEWEVNPKNGETTFKWIEPKKEEKQ